MNHESLDTLVKRILESGRGKEVLNSLADALMTEQTDRSNYFIYLGLDKPLDNHVQSELAGLITPFTDSFTLIPAKGFFRGESEHTVIVQIAAGNNKVAYECAEALRSHYAQIGVGVAMVSDGFYRRVI